MPGDDGDEIARAKSALADCVMSSSWKYCTFGIALAVPICVKLKSYNPLVYLGISGTLADYLEGYHNCQEQRAALEMAQKKVSSTK
eukprot:scaffold143380_cov45-Prasinocladus_malaysianus.AAC.1